MATTAWSWTRTWSRYKCTSRREREQVIRTLRTGRPSERFTLMLMVLYCFVCDVFLFLLLRWHQRNQNDPKQTRSIIVHRKEPVLLKSVSHRVHDDGFALRVFISQSSIIDCCTRQHEWSHTVSLSRTFNFRLDGTHVSSWPVITAACLDVSYFWRRHRNTHIFFRDC